MFISSNFFDMSNVIHHTIYSSVENGRFKLKEAEQCVIKLYYPLSIQFYSKTLQILKKTPTKDDLPEREQRPPVSILKNPTNLGFCMLQKAPFQAFQAFRF